METHRFLCLLSSTVTESLTDARESDSAVKAVTETDGREAQKERREPED